MRSILYFLYQQYEEFKYWVFRKKNGFPCNDEVADIIFDITFYDFRSIHSKKLKIYELYLSDMSIQDIAEALDIKEYQVKLTLNKLYMDYKKNRGVEL